MVLWRVINQFYKFDYEYEQTIVDLIDDPSLHLFRAMKSETNLFKKIRLFKWAYDMKNDERAWCRKFKNYVLVSSEDAKVLRSLDQTVNVSVISNGVDTDYFKPSNELNYIKANPTLLFTGAMDYLPNDDAMWYFFTKIYHFIKKDIPNVRLIIAGRNPSEKLKEITKGDSSITTTGFIEDIRPYFNMATVYVSPLRWGTGLKNKILEAWAMKKPIVATSISCDGLATINGKNILIADKIEQFAKQVITLLQNEKLRKEISEEGRKLAEEKYNWISKSLELEALFERIKT